MVKSRPPADTTPTPALESTADRTATVWPALTALLLFSVVFFSTTLPNNAPTTRLFLLQETPGLLFDWTLGSPPDDPAERHAAQTRGLRFLPQRLPLVATAALLLATATALGRLTFRSLGLHGMPLSCGTGSAIAPLSSNSQDDVPGAMLAPLRGKHASLPPLTSAELWALHTALGLSLWSLIVLGLGLAGLLSRPLFLGLAAVVIVSELLWTAITRCAALRPSADPSERSTESTASFWQTITTTRFTGGSLSTWLKIGCLPFLAIILLGAALPSTDFDVNEYHFGGPREYFLAGRIQFLDHNVYTSFPFLTEMLTLSAMVVHGDWFWGALAGKLLLSLYALLTALAVRALARQWAGPLAGDLAAFVWLTTPWVFRISTIAYVEGALACYLAIAWLVVSTSPLCGTRALLAGLFAGSAMACKYPGLVQVVLPIGAALLARSSTRDWHRLGPLYIAGIALAIGPWLLKNLFETGNPVYPLGWSLFGGRDWDAALNAKWRAAHGSASFPVWGFLDGLFDVSVRNDWLSPLLYGGLLAALWSHRALRRSVGPSLLFLFWLYLAWWGLTHRLDRFWVPMLPLAAAVAGAGLAGLMEKDDLVSQRAARRITVGLLTVVAAFNFVICGVGVAGYNDFLKDLPAARSYAARKVMPEIVWMNEHLPATAKVLCVGDAELFEARFTPVYNTVFDRSIFEQWCGAEEGDPRTKPLRPLAEIRQTLAAHGITHIYVNWSELLRYRTTYTYTDFVAPERLQALVDGGLLAPPVTPDDAWQRVASLPDSWRSQVESWGPLLIRDLGGERVIPLWSVYAVRAD